MKICAIIAEFNPFHNGHDYILKSIRKAGYTHIIVFMSGNYVQRGEPAIIPKEYRARSALKSGANLVIEIPTIKVLMTAEKYAFSALNLVSKFENIIDTLSFGAETENPNFLVEIYNALKEKSFESIVKSYLNEGKSFAVSREKAVEKILKNQDISLEIRKPNNILAIEYLKAIDKLNLDINYKIFKRISDPKKYMSASNIRKFICEKNNEYRKYIPEYGDFSEDLVANYFSNSREIICMLRCLEKKQFLELPDISEGIENRIYKAVKNSCSVEELFSAIKTKRYTMSRIKRIILCAFLGITSEMQNKNVPYLRVLGTDKKGLEIIRRLNFPVVTKYSEVLNLGKDAAEFFEIENKFTNLYYTFTNNIFPCEKEKTFKVIKGWEF